MRRASSPPRFAWLPLAPLLVIASGCGPTSFLITPVSPERELTERVVLRESVWATRKIALIDVNGVLENKAERGLLGPGGENPVSLLAEKLAKAANDGAVHAVVLRINSPGGTVTASDLMHSEVRRFRERTGKPVVAAMLDLATSGGYYVACAADAIYAQPTTVTGSIGVILLLPQLTGTMQKLGVEMNVIKSGAMKDAGSMFRALEPEDRAMFQRLIDGMYGRFFEVVREARPKIEAERLRELADGRVFLGPEAASEGLVDGVGTLRDAIYAAKAAAGLEGEAVKVVQYGRPLDYKPNIYARPLTAPAVNVVNVELPDWLRDPAPRLLYLWAPGF